HEPLRPEFPRPRHGRGCLGVLPPRPRRLTPGAWLALREELPHLLQELGTQTLVVEVQDEWVGDGTCDGCREYRRLNPRPRLGGSAHEYAVHARHHAPERLVVLQEAQHDRILLEDARHAATLDREVDHGADQYLTRSLTGSLAFGCSHGRFQTREHHLSDGK